MKDKTFIETSLYGGRIILCYNEEKHHYTVNGKTAEGVTNALKVIAKPALIPWAARMAGEYVSENLKVGQVVDEIQKDALIKGAIGAHKNKLTNAGDFGTLLHGWVEQWIKRQNPPLPTHPVLREAAVKFLQWVEANNVIFEASEKKVYSEKYGYAGTFDFIARVGGKLVIGDLKTSSGIWDEYWLQLAAYQQALEEEFPGVKIEDTMIIRCGKDGVFEVMSASEKKRNTFKENIKGFLAALALSRRMKELALKF